MVEGVCRRCPLDDHRDPVNVLGSTVGILLRSSDTRDRNEKGRVSTIFS